jgi:chromosome segregation ATPase
MSDRPKTAPGLAPAEWHGYALDCEERIAELEEERGKVISSLVAMDEIAEENKRLLAENSLIDAAEAAQQTLHARIAELEKERDQWQESSGQNYVRACEAEMREEKLQARIEELEEENRPVEAYPCAGWSVLHTSRKQET